MAARHHSLFLWTLFVFFEGSAFGEDTVTCVYRSSCVLPCVFSSGHDLIIAWSKREGAVIVHDYDHGRSQLDQQHGDYRGRTALFEGRVSAGNASLLLREVRVQDEGSYECLTSNGAVKRAFVRVRVAAPVVGVSLEQRGEQLLCRSQDIYPRPAVTWSFSPEPPDEPQTTVSPSETGLFSVLSSVPLSPSSPHEYICNISTGHSWRSATYRRNPEVTVSGSAVTVPCTKPTAAVKSLVWKFNHKMIINNKQTGSDRVTVYTESWRRFVEGLTESNGLVLKDLTQDQQGLFSCELFTETEKFVINTEVTKALTQKEPIDPELKFKVLEWLAVALFFICVIALVMVRCNEKNSRFRSLVECSKSNFRSLSQRVSRKSPDSTGREVEEGLALRGGKTEDDATQL